MNSPQVSKTSISASPQQTDWLIGANPQLTVTKCCLLYRLVEDRSRRTRMGQQITHFLRGNLPNGFQRPCLLAKSFSLHGYFF